ncbi:MAG: cupin domain-containing protein [Candidatus Magnetomorum sp.]|nr:cupin domain-containing protein [Candidatus Magnetomorum sp.]
MKSIDLDQITPRTVIPGYNGKFVHTDKLTLSFWEIEAGNDLPEHSHPHEQTTIVIEGTFQLNLEGTVFTLAPNQLLTILPNCMHSGTALSDCKVMDVFCPVREDYRL